MFRNLDNASRGGHVPGQCVHVNPEPHRAEVDTHRICPGALRATRTHPNFTHPNPKYGPHQLRPPVALQPRPKLSHHNLSHTHSHPLPSWTKVIGLEYVCYVNYVGPTFPPSPPPPPPRKGRIVRGRIVWGAHRPRGGASGTFRSVIHRLGKNWHYALRPQGCFSVIGTSTHSQLILYAHILYLPHREKKDYKSIVYLSLSCSNYDHRWVHEKWQYIIRSSFFFVKWKCK